MFQVACVDEQDWNLSITMHILKNNDKRYHESSHTSAPATKAPNKAVLPPRIATLVTEDAAALGASATLNVLPDADSLTCSRLTKRPLVRRESLSAPTDRLFLSELYRLVLRWLLYPDSLGAGSMI